jgi:hypothetical protein
VSELPPPCRRVAEPDISVDDHPLECERGLWATEAHLGSHLRAKRFEEFLDRGGLAGRLVQRARGDRGKLDLSGGADQLNIVERAPEVGAREALGACQASPCINQSARAKLAPATAQGPAGAEYLSNDPSQDGKQPERQVQQRAHDSLLFVRSRRRRARAIEFDIAIHTCLPHRVVALDLCNGDILPDVAARMVRQTSPRATSPFASVRPTGIGAQVKMPGSGPVY